MTSSDNHNICLSCINESYLISKIKNQNKLGKCYYCKNSSDPIITTEDLAKSVRGVFHNFYERTASEPDVYEWMALKDPESDYEWDREGERTFEIILDILDVDEKIATDLQEYLYDQETKGFSYSDLDAIGECEFDADVHYVETAPSSMNWRSSWNQFEKSLKMSSRFFNPDASKFLEELFADIEQEIEDNTNKLFVEDLELGRSLFRARVTQNYGDLKKVLERPDLELGPPPPKVAHAGRMNAHGISVFYGAFDQKTALSEVRPPVGSKVITGEFSVLRKLRVLDLSAVSSRKPEGSMFDPDFVKLASKWMFFKTLADEISKPIMPNDAELEYVSTQVIADFLASHPNLNIDGIIFLSSQLVTAGAQTKHKNIVLFNKSSRVKKMNLAGTTEPHTSPFIINEEGEHLYYITQEECSDKMTAEKNTSKYNSDFPFGPIIDYYPLYHLGNDERVDALSINLSSLVVHHIQGIDIQSDKHKVSRSVKTSNHI